MSRVLAIRWDNDSASCARTCIDAGSQAELVFRLNSLVATLPPVPGMVNFFGGTASSGGHTECDRQLLRVPEQARTRLLRCSRGRRGEPCQIRRGGKDNSTIQLPQ